MVIGYYALTEITVEQDFDLYYGPTKAASTIVFNGQFRLHVLPENITSILVVSRDFAGSQIEREALYGIDEAIEMKFIQPIKLDVDKKTGMGSFAESNKSLTVKPYKSKKKKARKKVDTVEE